MNRLLHPIYYCSVFLVLMSALSCTGGKTVSTGSGSTNSISPENVNNAATSQEATSKPGEFLRAKDDNGEEQMLKVQE